MDNKSSIKVRTFEKLLDRVSPEQRKEILQMLAEVKQRFLAYYNDHGAAQFTKAFYQIFDKSIAAPVQGGTSCKKGCHFCCGQNVDITDAEADVIVEYCQQHSIAIPRDYLLRQLTYGEYEIPISPVRWCVFLKNGECSIYPVRPLACRKYYVSTLPEMCDLVKYSPDEFKVVEIIFPMTEVQSAAFYELLYEKGIGGRLPEMLLRLIRFSPKEIVK